MEIIGFVEHHNDRGVSGWCIHADPDMRSTPVSLQLYIGDLLLREAYTNRPREDIRRGHHVGEAGFLFSLRPDLLELLPENSVLRVTTASGTPVLPLKETNIRPIGRAKDDGNALRTRLNEGWHIDQWGHMKIPFGNDPGRKAKYIQSMRKVSEFFMLRYGLPLFPAYGTLLGYARDGSLIDHDDDVDTAYLSRQQSLEGVAAEFWHIMRDMKNLGHEVTIVDTGHCNLSLRDSNLPGVDIFASWLSPEDNFFCYPRILEKAPGQVLFEKIELEGEIFIAPQPIEAFVKMMYGDNWKTPDRQWQSVVPRKMKRIMEALKVLSEDI
ncbi:hypothetical protein [Ectothiorhodospira haloalkaliphila]|nr:hypothetical protein [Ectothiorhodospira haloalkaliphila]